MVLSHTAEPQFSQPVRQIVMMLIVLGLTVALAVLIFPVVQEIFLASPYLKIFILLVFVIGVLACFWQVLTLIASVSWIEGFAIDRPGHEFTKAPRLLAPLAALLSGRRARRSLTSTSTRSILESVATRIEEQRDLTRYLINLLIFLGLLGTFYGLATVVPAVVEHHPLAGAAGGAERGASRFDSADAAGSRASSAAWARPSARRCSASPARWWWGCSSSSPATRRTASTASSRSGCPRSPSSASPASSPEEALTAANVLTVIGQTAEHIDQLREVVEQGVARSAETEARIVELAQILAAPKAPPVDNALLERIAAGQERMAQLLAAPPRSDGHDRALLERIALAQERMAAALGAREEEGGGGIDAETRARLRSIDTQVLRILEDLSAGRQDLVTEIRQDIAGLAEALRSVAARGRY